MSKVMEAIKFIEKYYGKDAGSAIDREPQWHLIKQALTPPTADEVCKALSEYYEYQNAIGKQLYDLSKVVKGVKLQETLELSSQNVYDLENEICVVEKLLTSPTEPSKDEIINKYLSLSSLNVKHKFIFNDEYKYFQVRDSELYDKRLLLEVHKDKIYSGFGLSWEVSDLMRSLYKKHFEPLSKQQ